MNKATGIIILIAILSLPNFMAGQTKFEREYRIREKDAPGKAVKFINAAFGNKKVKWYAEESQDGRTIEAKTKFRKYKYSVEFDTSGNLQDIEKTIDFDEIDAEAVDEITKSLTIEFGDFKILKIQVQYTSGNPETIREIIKKGDSQQPFSKKYEIVLETRVDKAYKAFEVLIAEDGQIEKLLEMDLRTMDNMQF